MTEQERHASFEAVVRPVIEWLNENGHPHMVINVTTVGAELLSGELATGPIFDYVKD